MQNVNRLIIGNLNINSIPGKFDQLKLLVQGKVDILVITESKLDSSFPTNQFIIDGFSKPYRLDRNRNGGGILIYIRQDIPSKELKIHTFSDDVEGIFVELNLRKVKWLLLGTYHPPSQSKEYYINNISRALDIYNQNYDIYNQNSVINFCLQEILTWKTQNHFLSDFLNQYDAKNIVHDKTCLKV